MIRIDLLPGYVAKRRLTIQLIACFSVLFIVITLSLLGYNFAVLAPQASAQEDAASTAEAAQTKLNGVKALAASTLAEIAPVQAKLQFVEDVADYNRSWVALYDQLARYTDPKLIYASAAVSGSTMSISAYTPSIDEVGRYLERMYLEPDFTTVSIDHLPGYPESVINKYYLNGKLIAVGELPGLNDARPGQGGQTGLQGQYGSQGPNSPFTGGQQNNPYGQAGPGGQGGLNGQNGLSNNGLPTFGSVINPLTAQEIPNGSLDEMIDQVVSPLATGDQVTRLRNVVRARLLRQVVVKHQIRGFQIVVAATLKKPFTPPIVPTDTSGAAAGAATTTGFGGPTGMPGPGGAPGMAPGGGPPPGFGNTPGGPGSHP